MLSHIKPTLIIKTREKEFEIELFEEDYDSENKPKVRFVQEVRRIHLA
ncbi:MULTISPECIES: hypothetical protein [Thermococcus]|nr:MULTISPECIES: hypothetical protein [Thermococcus]MBO8175126.1 hypothetical protein [Thermococcus sp.]